MKRLLHIGIAVIGLFILFAVTAYADVEINETHFPDPVFRQYIIDAGFDFNGDGILSSAEISEVRKIECERKDLRSLKGIEYFTELEELLCSNNQLTSLDVKKNTALTALECWNNDILSLDVSHNTELTRLDCSANALDTLDVSQNRKLTWLNCCCSNKQRELILGDIDTLEFLDCQANRLTRLDVSKNTKLKVLECGRNDLTSLDISRNIALTEVECERNQLRALDVSRNPQLERLWCHENKITELDLSGCQILLEQIKKYPEYRHDHYVTYGPDYGDPLILSYYVSFDEITKVILGDTVIMPTATPEEEAPTEDAPTEEAPAVGDVFTVNGLDYKVTSASTVSVTKVAKGKSRITIPATVSYYEETFKVTGIAAKAFFKNTKVTGVMIGKNVKTIGKSSFEGCKRLKAIKGGAAVAEIKEAAFKGCVKLTGITLGKNVKDIGKNAFRGCRVLKTITVKTTKLTSSTVKAGAFKGIHSKATFRCPKEKLKEYKALFVNKGAPKTAKFK